MTTPVNVSSTMTLVVKYGIPTFWIGFFGSMTLVAFITSDITMQGVSLTTLRIMLGCFMIMGLGLMYLIVGRLMRVEMDHEFMYVTNYFKIYKYPYSNILAIDESKLGPIALCTVTFKEKGSFGKYIRFLSSRRLDTFLKANPKVAQQLLRE